MTATFSVRPVTLVGEHVRLEPLAPGHAPGLFAVGTDPTIWEFLPTAPFAAPGDADAYVANALARAAGGNEVPFAVIDRASGAVAGTTRYLDVRPADRGLEIGWTWYGVSYQRTAVNTATKLLLLTHAFQTLGAIRVQLKTDARNERSQRAIERLGAVREGVLRSTMILPKDGYVRDSVYYSIIASEWPAVRARLQARLRPPDAPSSDRSSCGSP
jgi:RimJ/RimL family protein N-acetyltransferase